MVSKILAIAPLYRLGITLAFVALIVALSIAPGIERPGDSVFSWLVVNTAKPVQKLMHAGVYALLAVLWMWTLESIQSGVLRIGLTLIACLGLGAALEWHQTRVPGRYGTLFDVLLNAAGTVIGVIIAVLSL